MHIKSLKLENFRGASNLNLSLHPKLNVFYGVNGSGKSTVLDASAILLSWLVNRLKTERASGRQIHEHDIQNDAPNADIKMVFETENSQLHGWNLVKGRRYRSANGHRSKLTEITNFTNNMRQAIAAQAGEINIPLFAYYPINRTVLDIPLRIRKKHSFDLQAAFDGSLTSGANFRTFFEWYREREDIENEMIRHIGNDQLDEQLEAVRKAITTLLPEFSNITVRRNPLRMEIEKRGKKLIINQLSDGEKCLMAMVGDLARRLAIANPVIDDPLKGTGVILIDEIDLHLHPKWQQMIVPKLLEVFPNCQFLMSTHSPSILANVKPESLFMLQDTSRGVKCSHPSESYGKSVDRILEDIMGLETARPSHIDEKLRLLFRNINHGRLSEARATLKELSTKIGSDPELAKADVLIRRKEAIGK